MENTPAAPVAEQPGPSLPDTTPARTVRRVFIPVITVFAVGFAAAAWGPTGEPPFGLFEGLAGIAFGVVLTSLPVLAFSLAITSRRILVKVLVGAPLAVIALYAGFIWGAMTAMSRNPDWSLH